MLAVEQVEIAVQVDSMTEPEGGLSLTSEQIEADPKMMAERGLDHLEKRRARMELRAERRANTMKKGGGSAEDAAW